MKKLIMIVLLLISPYCIGQYNSPMNEANRFIAKLVPTIDELSPLIRKFCYGKKGDDLYKCVSRNYNEYFSVVYASAIATVCLKQEGAIMTDKKAYNEFVVDLNLILTKNGFNLNKETLKKSRVSANLRKCASYRFHNKKAKNRDIVPLLNAVPMRKFSNSIAFSKIIENIDMKIWLISKKANTTDREKSLKKFLTTIDSLHK